MELIQIDTSRFIVSPDAVVVGKVTGESAADIIKFAGQHVRDRADCYFGARVKHHPEEDAATVIFYKD